MEKAHFRARLECPRDDASSAQVSSYFLQNLKYMHYLPETKVAKGFKSRLIAPFLPLVHVNSAL